MTQRRTAPKPPLRWTGIVFAFAVNVLLVTLTHSFVQAARLGLNSEVLATVIAPLIAGAATAIYTQARGGVHALLGSIFALPVLGLYVFPNAWPLAVFAAAFCTMGGAATELGLRGRTDSPPR